jgi:hypothetical protein
MSRSSCRLDLLAGHPAADLINEDLLAGCPSMP